MTIKRVTQNYTPNIKNNASTPPISGAARGMGVQDGWRVPVPLGPRKDRPRHQTSYTPTARPQD